MTYTAPLPSDTPDRAMSLTVALQTIARNTNTDIPLDDLHALLGSSLLACAVPTENRLGDWAMYARDAFLVEAGRLYGIAIREMHPPEAARGLVGAEEFVQHFDASYRPLIARALENQQPVLAWRGWPGDRQAMWGIITNTCPEGIGLAGLTLAPAPGDTGVVSLVAPPVQVYIVEAIAPTIPSPEGCMAVALKHARLALDAEAGKRFGAVTGPAAYDMWIARIDDARPASAAGADPAGDHARFASSVVTGHESAWRYLRNRLSEATAPTRKLLEALMGSCGVVASSLSPLRTASAVRAMTRTVAGRGEFAKQLTRARDASEDMRTLLQSHAKSVRPAR